MENPTLPAMRTEFGKRLFESRKRLGLTQAELSKRVGMSQANYNKLEREGAGTAFTPALADVLGVDVQWLAYGKDADSPAAPSKKSLSPHAIALGTLFDRVPTSDPILWAVTYQKATQVVLDAIQGTQANPALEHHPETQDESHQSSQETRKSPS